MPTEPLQQRARSKIVATVGPACNSPEMLARMADAGVDVFRLNTAHGTLAEHNEIHRRVRKLSDTTRPLGVLVDLAGPKIRLGELVGDIVLCGQGTTFEFIRGNHADDPRQLVCNYERLIDELKIGDNVLLADGTVHMVVIESYPDRLVCEVVHEGTIRTRQGINLPGAKVSLPALTEKDREWAKWAATTGADFVSLSFVRSPDELVELRGLLSGHGSSAPIIAKIEKPEALDDLDSIVEVADGVMVARGDLGVEVDVADVPVIQKEIIETCNRLQKPVIVATQMLDSMQQSPRPTRAEVSDVANAILDGADACMLSGETAIGEYPLQTVKMMNRIMLSTERRLSGRPSRPPAARSTTGAHPITHSVVYGAAKIAEHLQAALVVIATRSGATALTKSSQRDFVRTIAVSSDPAVLRKMTLYWGVTPLAGCPLDDRLKLWDFVRGWGEQDGVLSHGDCAVVVTGSGVAKGAHNLLVVHTVD